MARAIRPTPTLVITGAVVLLTAISQLVVTDGFFSRGSLSTLTPLIGILVLVAVGQAFVISTGGIDLSLPGTMTWVGAIVLEQPKGADGGLFGAVVLCAGVCVLIGLVNGILVEGLGLNSLVVTLAVGQLVLGCTQLYRGAVPQVQRVPDNLAAWATAGIGGVSGILLASVALAVLATFFLHRVVAGRRLVAVSTAKRAAVLTGIRASLYRMAAYVVAALVYGVGGLLAAGQTGTPDLTLGEPYLLTSVVAVVLGGAALTGGRVSPIATLMGAVFVTVLDFDLRVLGLSAGARLIVQGAVLALGLSLINVVRHRAEIGRALRRLAA
ncbi:ABC transporter permease [Amycolatopsis pithecellobii]|uniref:ABC transporter permease n=1 Tax=Amycolatopsis pithecellobii TaxID=664692 RepID=UPI00140BD83A|nr:ABC transporter permease [Amycolatopsis pithecellobii]